ncbi:DUF1778 domain-containing protein [Leifsonia shinshuensis]|uniref:Uncharacterized protein (DUF1778 family) n=1 Tax=Leifsonia shinshuensis TaxID=150026 RepID=A0A853CUU7_9MICO|nr:DUF1778 domain-containing protein [Leifsonia shinshuensis]NYJ22974.1 uncharacterized protein (DUF1778 family) [Leifsonia shinshuensis]
MTALAPAKTERLNLRLSAEARDTLRAAAELAQQDLTSFILGPALQNARDILLQDALIKLTPAEALQVERALDEPAVASKPLADLITRVRATREATEA